MTYQYKSKTMQALAAQRDTQAGAALQELVRIKEKVEILTGERGKDPAVRRSDVKPLASLKMQSTQVSDLGLGGTPSFAQYNALQKDVAEIYAAIVKIARLFG